jgi:tetratricopeptide (TPR) repeat protein
LLAEAVSAEELYAELDELDRLSNSVPKLIAQGRLDEAEAACRELHRLYPDQIDWLERSALVCQARGQPKLAADYYRKAVAFTLSRPDGFDDDSRAWMLDKIRELDPTALDDER